MSVRAWALVGLGLGVVLGLLYFAPAAWLAQAVYSASAGRVLLTQTQGRVWQGSAQLFLLGGDQSQDASALPGRVSWRLQPAGFNGLAADISASCCTDEPLRLKAQGHWGGWQLDALRLDSRWPAAWLGGLGAPWNTLQLQGELRLSSPQGLRWRQSGQAAELQGAATLEVWEVSSRIASLQPLGSYRLLLQAATLRDVSDQSFGTNTTSPTAAQLSLQTLAGALQLSGQGLCQVGVRGLRASFSGEASSADEHLPQLSNLLNIIGRRQGNRSLLVLN
jgi:general secretion pathway protein N